MSTPRCDTIAAKANALGRWLSVRRLLLALLALETLAFLSLRIGAILPLGLLAITVASLLIWAFIRWTRTRFRFSLRTLLVMTILFSVLFAGLVKIRPALEQRRLVQAIQRLGGQASYDLDMRLWNDGWFVTPSGRLLPRWLHSVLGNDFFAKVNRVQFLGAQLSESDLRTLRSLPAVVSLALNKTGMTDGGLAYLADHPNLCFLSLDSCPITDDGLAHLASIRSLRYLVLNDTKITDAGLRHLSELRSLQSLNLHGTDVSDAGISHLRRLHALRHLYLGNTQVTSDGLTKLKELLPNCEIEQ